MIIGTSEGDRYRFEVVLMSHGFIVRARSVETGEVTASRDRLFRTAPAAFAFAELAAARDSDDTRLSHIEALEAKLASDRAARLFDEIRDRLADGGVSATLLSAWERRREIESAFRQH